MNTKNIFKALALAMLMPAMVLTTACSNDDSIVNNEPTAKKGFELPVTVNVTREGDDATRATYNDVTKKLGFSTGDKLLVRGNDESVGGAGRFAGMLDYDTEKGNFSGTIITENAYTGTANALLTSAGSGAGATLLPNGYESTGFLYVATNGTEEKYDDQAAYNYNNAFALTKAAGVEQLSYEHAGYYDNGFTLSPSNPILNFTITGLSANTEVAVAFSYYAVNVNKNVTTNSSGTATFAIGVACSELNDCSLTVGGNVITLGSHVLTAGYIYNISRSATATTLSELKTAINGGTDCSSYIGWEVNSAGAIAASSVSGTKIGYVALVSTSNVDAGVSGSRILVLAAADAGTSILWGSKGTSRDLTADDLNGYSKTNTLQGYGSEAHPAAYAAWNYSAAIPSGGATPAHWFMPTKKQWENMRDVHSGSSNTQKRSAMNSAFGINGFYWTSTEYSNNNAYHFSTNGSMPNYSKEGTIPTNVRAVFAY